MISAVVIRGGGVGAAVGAIVGIGVLFGVAGLAYQPAFDLTSGLYCDKPLKRTARSYSYKPGQRGVEVSLHCGTKSVTVAAIATNAALGGAAFAVFLLAFLALRGRGGGGPRFGASERARLHAAGFDAEHLAGMARPPPGVTAASAGTLLHRWQAQADELNLTGRPATAVIRQFEPLGVTVNKIGVAATLRVEVTPADGPPFLSEVHGVFSVARMHNYAPGSTIHVKHDPADTRTVAIDTRWAEYEISGEGHGSGSAAVGQAVAAAGQQTSLWGSFFVIGLVGAIVAAVMALGSSEGDPAGDWDGTTSLVCGGDQVMRLEGKHIVYKPVAPGSPYAIFVGGNCKIDIVDCNIEADMPLGVGGSARVRLTRTVLKGWPKGVMVGGDATLEIDGGSTIDVRRPVLVGGSARVRIQPGAVGEFEAAGTAVIEDLRAVPEGEEATGGDADAEPEGLATQVGTLGGDGEKKEEVAEALVGRRKEAQVCFERASTGPDAASRAFVMFTVTDRGKPDDITAEGGDRSFRRCLEDCFRSARGMPRFEQAQSYVLTIDFPFAETAQPGAKEER